MSEQKTDLMDLGVFEEDNLEAWNEYTPTGEDEKTNENTDTKTDEIKSEENKNEDTPTVNWLSEFNKSFNSQYSTIDEVKNVFEEYTTLKEKEAKIKDYDTLSEQKEKLEKTKSLLIEKYRELQDPKSFFADDVEYKRNQLMKNNPTVNGEVARKVFSIDLNSANPLDVIALNMQLTHSKISGGEAGAKEMFLARHGIDGDLLETGEIDFENLTRAQKNIINVEAEEAARNIVKLRDDVKMPETSKEVEELVNEWMAEREQPPFDMTQWNGKIDTVLKGVDVFELKDGDSVLYSESIDAEFSDGLKEFIEEFVNEKRIEPTEENIRVMIEEAKDVYFKENRSAIMKRWMNAETLKLKEQLHNEIHNDTDPDKPRQQHEAQTGKTTPLSRVLGLR